MNECTSVTLMPAPQATLLVAEIVAECRQIAKSSPRCLPDIKGVSEGFAFADIQ